MSSLSIKILISGGKSRSFGPFPPSRQLPRRNLALDHGHHLIGVFFGRKGEVYSSSLIKSGKALSQFVGSLVLSKYSTMC